MSDGVRKALANGTYSASVEALIKQSSPVTVGHFIDALKRGASGVRGIDITTGNWPYSPTMGGQFVWTDTIATTLIRKIIKPLTLHNVLTQPNGYKDDLKPYMALQANNTLKSALARKCYQVAKEMGAANPYNMGAIFFVILCGETKGQGRLWNGCSDFGLTFGKADSTAYGLGQWLHNNNLLYWGHAIAYMRKSGMSVETLRSSPLSILEQMDIYWSFFVTRLLHESTAASWWRNHKNLQLNDILGHAKTFMTKVQGVNPDDPSFGVDVKYANFYPIYSKTVKKN